MTIDERIGKNIKKIREDRGLSKMDLSKLLDYSFSSTLAKIEQGEVSTNPQRLVQISEALGVSVATLFGEAEFRSQKETFATKMEIAYKASPEKIKTAVRVLLDL